MNAGFDGKNRQFWEEPCGSALARSMGLRDLSAGELQHFDRRYLELYPWLRDFLAPERFNRRRILEIGPGFGTLSTLLLEAGADYVALDVADGPLRMVRHRAALCGKRALEIAGSILGPPLAAESFDAVLAIGCLHHTGHLPQAVASIYRLLRPGGILLAMVYHRFSLRRLVREPGRWLRERWRDVPAFRQETEAMRARYDHDHRGTAAPATCFASVRDLKRLCQGFRELQIRQRNFVHLACRGRILIPRNFFFGNLDRVLGLDLYLQARK